MKKINLTFIRVPEGRSWNTEQNSYSVLLGNEIRASFSNEKKAHKFLAETNRFLNAQMHELNQILAQAYLEYRRAWFSLENDSLIDESLKDITRAFRKPYRNNHSENANYFVFIDIMRLVHDISSVIEKISEYHRENNNYLELNSVATLLFRINNVNEALKNWGRDLTNPS